MNTATVGDVVEEARSKELYNMILSSVAEGHALNTIEKARDNNNGVECAYLAWKSLKDWYLDPTQVDSMISHWENKMDKTALDVDSTSATEYINNFEMYVRKLVKLGKNWSDDKRKVREFKKSVADPDYETEVRVHNGNFAKLIETVRKREQDLGRAALDTSRVNKRSRRVKYDDETSEDEDKRKSDKYKRKGDTSKVKPFIPFMPKFVFASTLNSEGKTNFTTWRRMVNQGETMEKKDLGTSKEVAEDAATPSKKPGKYNKGESWMM